MKHSHINPNNDDIDLSRSPIFKQLTLEEMDRVNNEKNVNFFKKGVYIYHEGNRINGIYIVLKGILKIFKTGIDGKEQIIRFAKPYDLIAFRSVLSGELACTTAKTLEDSVLAYIPQETLFNLVKTNGLFSLELLQLSCRELGEANEYITDIAQKSVRERLAEILVHLKDSFGTDDNNELQIVLTREELANIVGTATESVIRLLSEFKSDNLVEINGRKIKILNYSALRKIASYN